MENRGSGFTLPAEAGMEREIKELAKKWGADAVRDSDGTVLSQEIIDMGFKVYSTLCLIREDNEWAKKHPQYAQEIYLMSEPVVAFDDTLTINIMEDYFHDQFRPVTHGNIGEWWQVIDKTTGEDVDKENWMYFEDAFEVKINRAKRYHEYVVIFLAKQMWEPVSMYNHITNKWTKERRIPVDVRHREVRKHILSTLKKWLDEHPKTDVVRFTTFFYNFDLIYNREGKEKRVDWFGYLSCVSPAAILEFEREYGYRLRPNDFVNFGYYNNPFMNPSKKYLDWMEFNQKFVSEFARQCVDMVHAAGKKAIMFFGDHWIGTEPYGKYFKNIGLDAVVGAAGDGVTTRMIADIPIKETEARFYPYFFPDIFHEGGNPVEVSKEIWIKCRRAILQKPMKRMGYGGYLSLAVKFPDFIEHVKDIRKQFGEIWDYSKGQKPYKAPIKIGVLNSWGAIRTWQTHQVTHFMWNRKCYSYLGVFEALAGLPVEVEFLSFDDIRKDGIRDDINLIINAGDAYTSWSGGENWKDVRIIELIREWVANGGGFIGVGEPTAYEYNGSYFQLSDILGVQKEIGYTVNNNKLTWEIDENHFILMDKIEQFYDPGEDVGYIYKTNENASILADDGKSCTIAANTYGLGRSVYFRGLPFSMANTRLLLRAIYWCTRMENEINTWFSENINTECVYYPQSSCFAVVNNSCAEQKTKLHMPDGRKIDVALGPMELKWYNTNEV